MIGIEFEIEFEIELALLGTRFASRFDLETIADAILLQIVLLIIPYELTIDN